MRCFKLDRNVSQAKNRYKIICFFVIIKKGESDFMNLEKLRFLDELNALNLPKEEYALGGSAPLVVRGLKEINQDLDLLVTRKLWNALAKKAPIQIFENGTQRGEYISIGNIDFIKCLIGVSETETELVLNQAEVIEGYRFVTLEDVIKWKKILNRDKDLQTIRLIEEYLQKS